MTLYIKEIVIPTTCQPKSTPALPLRLFLTKNRNKSIVDP